MVGKGLYIMIPFVQTMEDIVALNLVGRSQNM